MYAQPPETPLGLAFQVHLQQAVNPPNLLVVPGLALLAQHGEELAEAPGRFFLGQLSQRGDHLAVVARHGLIRVVVSTYRSRSQRRRQTRAHEDLAGNWG